VSVLENRHQSRNAAAVISGPLSILMNVGRRPVVATIPSRIPTTASAVIERAALPVVTLGKRGRRIPRAALERWIETRTTGDAAPLAVGA
jgi:hypothetical protein